MTSILKVDSIEERTSGNGISFTGTLSPDGLRLAQKTVAERNNLTAVEGDVIYNTDDNRVEFYNGTTWGPISSGASVGLVLALGE
tara:strand:+ start:2003 stop:2257 length:255 start_codon:yes stop_codon:yes gene_type:complete